MKAPPLFLIDAYALIYRAYFAFLNKPLRDSEGRNVSALFGFTRALIALLDGDALKEALNAKKADSLGEKTGDEYGCAPCRLAAVFDSRKKTFRHELYPEYKANRQKTPEDLHAQVPMVEETLAALGVPLLRVDGFEADDLIATLAERCRVEGRACYIVSGDKDLLQLVGGDIYELRPGKGAAPYELIDEQTVLAEWGVPSLRILDLLSLTGDASDNVPGVKGIGEKTAAKLLARYGDLDGIYANLPMIEGSAGKKLAEGRDMAYFSRDLIDLKRDVPLPLKSIDELDVSSLDRAAAAAVLLRYGARSLASALTRETRAPAAGERPPSSTPSSINADKLGGDIEAPSSPAPIRSIKGPKPLPQPIAEDAHRVPGVYSVIGDLEALDRLLARAKAQSLIALDFETDSLDAWNATPLGLALSVAIGEAYYVPLSAHPLKADEESGAETVKAPFLEPEAVRDRVAALTADPSMTIIAHNAKYDYEVSRAWGIERWRCRIWDSMVAAWLVDGDRASYALDALVNAWLGLSTTPFASLVPKGKCFGDVPLEAAAAYAAEDADYALRVKTLLEPLLDGELAKLFHELEMPLLPILAEMEGAGIHIDSETLTAYSRELAEELKGIERSIYDLVGHEFNIASTKQLQQVLFVERKLKTGKKTKTGYSTDVAVLETLAREDPVPERILRYRQLAKLKSTYVDALPLLSDTDGRLHTTFSQTGTATGRLSSRDPNLQNIPIRDEEGRRIRAAFRAGNGRVLVSADYSQIELVVLAHLSNDPRLREAFQSGQDVHRRTAALIFGISEAEVSPEKRRAAKTINFGVMYGMSAFRLSNELKISRTEAQLFIEAYFKTYAGVNAYIQTLISQAENTGYATTLLGRRRPIPAINSSNKTEKAAAERMAVNTPIQGSAADIVKLAMLRVDKALAKEPGARLLLQVHDELILECDESAAERIAALTETAMEGAYKLSIPLRTAIEIGRSWGELH